MFLRNRCVVHGPICLMVITAPCLTPARCPSHPPYPKPTKNRFSLPGTLKLQLQTPFPQPPSHTPLPFPKQENHSKAQLPLRMTRKPNQPNFSTRTCLAIQRRFSKGVSGQYLCPTPALLHSRNLFSPVKLFRALHLVPPAAPPDADYVNFTSKPCLCLLFSPGVRCS